jgi:hypothetical protein
MNHEEQAKRGQNVPLSYNSANTVYWRIYLAFWRSDVRWTPKNPQIRSALSIQEKKLRLGNYNVSHDLPGSGQVLQENEGDETQHHHAQQEVEKSLKLQITNIYDNRHW